MDALDLFLCFGNFLVRKREAHRATPMNDPTSLPRSEERSDPSPSAERIFDQNVVVGLAGTTDKCVGNLPACFRLSGSIQNHPRLYSTLDLSDWSIV